MSTSQHLPGCLCPDRPCPNVSHHQMQHRWAIPWPRYLGIMLCSANGATCCSEAEGEFKTADGSFDMVAALRHCEHVQRGLDERRAQARATRLQAHGEALLSTLKDVRGFLRDAADGVEGDDDTSFSDQLADVERAIALIEAP
jgi:hypothetical protein